MSRVTEWRALDYCDNKEKPKDAVVEQKATQANVITQKSEEWIIIKDSEDIKVTTTDTKAAASLQVGIEAALALVLRISLDDCDQVEDILQDFKQVTRTRQSNRQKTIIEKSKHIEIETLDTDIAINLQLLVQLLLAVIATLDIL